MRVSLYNPPTHYYTRRELSPLPVLSLAILAGVLNEAGHEAFVYDMEATKINTGYFHTVDEWHKIPDVIGFTCLTVSAQGVKDCIRELRQSDYRGKIVVGGIHPTVRPDEVLSWGADLVVTGECEGNIVDLLESDVTGIHAGEKMPIDDIPSPDWDNYYPDITSYKGQYRSLAPRASVAMWTRGCPYKCIYCANLIFNGQPIRHRQPAVIAEEMVDIKRRGIDNVFTYDDELIGSKQPEGWMSEIADRVEPLDMMWLTQGRCSEKYVTADILAGMKRAGCEMIFWGVESFAPNVLKHMRKGNKPDDIWHTLRLSHEAGIKNCVYTIIGSYKETDEDLAITADALKQGYEEGVIDHLQTFACKIMPGTKLEQLSIEEGWYSKPKTAIVGWTQPQDTPWLSAEQITKWKSIFRGVCPVGKP